jgi:hypothetical protein
MARFVGSDKRDRDLPQADDTAIAGVRAGNLPRLGEQAEWKVTAK